MYFFNSEYVLIIIYEAIVKSDTDIKFFAAKTLVIKIIERKHIAILFI